MLSMLACHGEMNRFLKTKMTREMRGVLKYYLNNPLQLLFNEKPEILSSKNHLLAHWSPQWPHPELHRIGGRKSEYLALSSIFQVLAFTKPLKGCLGHKMALLSSPESSLSLRNDSFHREEITNFFFQNLCSNQHQIEIAGTFL